MPATYAQRHSDAQNLGRATLATLSARRIDLSHVHGKIVAKSQSHPRGFDLCGHANQQVSVTTRLPLAQTRAQAGGGHGGQFPLAIGPPQRWPIGSLTARLASV
jgi:hypothetical protein